VCSSKYVYPPHGWSLEILQGWGGSQIMAKMLKGKYEAKLGISGGVGWGSKKKPSLREVWIFSGTTHCALRTRQYYLL